MEKDTIFENSMPQISHSTAAPQGARPSRELNPALFGEGPSSSRVIDGTAATQLPHLMQTDQKLQEFKNQMSMMAEHFGKMVDQINEMTKSNHHKFEKIQQTLHKLESNDHYIVNESSQKFARINDRFAERKTMDAKTQEMIDRHNSVLKSFEMRLAQMQKVIADKEALLLSAQSALNETKMELARLKRL